MKHIGLWPSSDVPEIQKNIYVHVYIYVCVCVYIYIYIYVQGGSNMTRTDLCVNKPHKSQSYLNHLVYI
jgi:hypothetical protein